MPARRREREKATRLTRCRADDVALGVFALPRALCACEDVVAGIVFLWARLVATGSTVDELLVGDPHSAGRRDVEKPVPGCRVVDDVYAREEVSACLSSGESLALVAMMLV